MQNGNVEVKINNGIAEIIFYHPKSNSLPGKLLRELADKFSQLSINDDVKIIVLKSEGNKAFCAGASFDELLEIKDFETGKNFFMGFALLINSMRKCPKLIIARIHGKAVGGGVGIAAAADYSFAHSSASVKLSELALGIGPFVVGPAVERKIGKSAFSQMSIDYEWYPAQWAKEKGLYNEIYNTVEELDSAIQKLSEKLAAGSKDAMNKLKEVLWEGTEDWDSLLEKRAGISGELILSEFSNNYINNFKKSN
ncbi:MAG: enoyl-CoA hydratase/isomerase family protein [Bacteroidetes bacterium]|nr:enoyl-CoA hydratase/isomerase family protein [Bacteroidota bacterium]